MEYYMNQMSINSITHNKPPKITIKNQNTSNVADDNQNTQEKPLRITIKNRNSDVTYDVQPVNAEITETKSERILLQTHREFMCKGCNIGGYMAKNSKITNCTKCKHPLTFIFFI